MAIQYLKKGIDEQQRSEDNEKIKSIVEETLKKIEKEGDKYIRELSDCLLYTSTSPRDRG